MRRSTFLIIIVCLFACKSSVPKDVLPPKKMQSVLWDMMQADEMADYYSAKDSGFKQLPKRVDYYQKVFSIHKITKGDFTKSLAYYENHPDRLQTILDSLQSFGARLQTADSAKKSYNPIGNDTSKKNTSAHPVIKKPRVLPKPQ